MKTLFFFQIIGVWPTGTAVLLLVLTLVIGVILGIIASKSGISEFVGKLFSDLTNLLAYLVAGLFPQFILELNLQRKKHLI